MKSIFIISIFLSSFLTKPLLSEISNLTGQLGNKVIYKGKEFIIHDYLMESYFAKHPDKKPQPKFNSSALKRGYIATYEICNEKLFLIDIKIRIGSSNREDNWSSIYAELFPNTYKKRIHWKNGFLVLLDGEIINEFTSPPINSNYIVFEFKKGKVKHLKKYTTSEFQHLKKEQLSTFKKTAKYRSLIKCFKKTRLKPMYNKDDMDFYLKKNILFYTKKFFVQ